MKHNCLKTVGCLIALALVSFAVGEDVLGETRPGDLLIYYAYPSTINGSVTISQAAAEFGVYDIVVLGDGLQDGPTDPNPHPDHENTAQIIGHVNAEDTLFFGYIDLGVSTYNHSLAEIERRVDAWRDMGIDGIFLDDFGYDYSVSRARQNAAVDYVHSQELPVCANGWIPDDVFGGEIHANNPAGLPTHLGPNDYYLSESYQVAESAYVDEEQWQEKANKLAAYQRQLQFKILSNTTADVLNVYDEAKFHYAWYSAALYNHAAIAWGEFEYAASTASVPFRPRPAETLGAVFKSGVWKDNSLYQRRTERGTIYVNAGSRLGGIMPDADADGDGVSDFYDLCPATPYGITVNPNGSPKGDLDCSCTVDLRDFAILQGNFSG